MKMNKLRKQVSLFRILLKMLKKNLGKKQRIQTTHSNQQPPQFNSLIYQTATIPSCDPTSWSSVSFSYSKKVNQAISFDCARYHLKIEI